MLLNLSLFLAPITIFYLHQSPSFSSTLQLFHRPPPPPQFFLYLPCTTTTFLLFSLSLNAMFYLHQPPSPTFLLFRYFAPCHIFIFIPLPPPTPSISTTFLFFSSSTTTTLRIKYNRFLYLIRWECQHCWTYVTGVGREKGREVLYFSFVLFSPLPSFAPATQVNIGWCQVLTNCHHDAARLCLRQDDVRVCCPHNFI